MIPSLQLGLGLLPFQETWSQSGEKRYPSQGDLPIIAEVDETDTPSPVESQIEQDGTWTSPEGGSYCSSASASPISPLDFIKRELTKTGRAIDRKEAIDSLNRGIILFTKDIITLSNDSIYKSEHRIVFENKRDENIRSLEKPIAEVKLFDLAYKLDSLYRRYKKQQGLPFSSLYIRECAGFLIKAFEVNLLEPTHSIIRYKNHLECLIRKAGMPIESFDLEQIFLT